ncbi:hypothetical protein [Cellulomonas triticagri]|uniref:Uncharacterized protein n=1 Tax=Cellulomonas triticagri TaxID=2483352 RepID=A0A3M2JRP1_9CELL|nr:hypothetical protein [Cellulomonas triticagri]RMI13385.1 hypothetical protein EBM89_04515 [Cellulomonas triticagri]
MRRRRLPRIAALSGADAALARHVAVHSPVAAGPAALTWTLTLLAEGGGPLAESRTTSPDFPVPLADIAQVHLDVVGLVQAGEWEPVPVRGGGVRFQAPVRVAPLG